MAERVVMPKLGLTAEGATLTRWLVETGAEVGAGTPLCEIETDKIAVEVEAPVAGVLLACADAGTVVPVGAVIALIGDAAEAVDPGLLHVARPDLGSGPNADAADQPDRRPADHAEVGPRTDSPRVAASPAARALAARHSLDLSALTGSGPSGRITIDDVEAAIGARGPAD